MEKEENIDKVLFFWGHNSNSSSLGKECLSNWYSEKKFKDPKTNITYCNNEQFMMAGKAKLFNDEEIFAKILSNSNPKQCKILGRKVKNFDGEVWNKNCIDIVSYGCYLKFSQNKNLKEFLLSTGDKLLVESSPYDKIWGIGLGENKAKRMKPEEWPGKNYLGKCLMSVREKLKKENK